LPIAKPCQSPLHLVAFWHIKSIARNYFSANCCIHVTSKTILYSRIADSKRG
jgi:hypothetical protein